MSRSLVFLGNVTLPTRLFLGSFEPLGTVGLGLVADGPAESLDDFRPTFRHPPIVPPFATNLEVDARV